MDLALHPEFWWYATRATGVTAWIAALGSMLAGLALATRTFGPRPRGPWLLDLHRGLAAISLLFTLAHIGALVVDSYVHFGFADIVVPFASDWRPLAVAGGVVALWLYGAVQVSSLAMKRLPKPVWRTIHLSSYAGGAAATFHAFAAGSDASNPGILAVAIGAVVAGAFMLTYRWSGPRRPARRIPARVATAPVAAPQAAAATAAGSPEPISRTKLVR